MGPFDPRLTLIAAQAKVKTCHVYHCWQAMQEMGKQFHPAAFASFAGLEERHVTAIMESLAANNALPEKAARAKRIATRLPLDWHLPDDWRDYAQQKKRWDNDTVSNEAERFRNYWLGKSGKDATKADWAATWRNWVIGPYSAPVGVYNPNAKALSAREAIQREIDVNVMLGRTYEEGLARAKLARLDSNVVPIKVSNTAV